MKERGIGKQTGRQIGRRIGRRIGAGILAAIMLCTQTQAEVNKLSISQMTQKGNDVYLYVSAMEGETTEAKDQLRAEQFTVSIDDKETIPAMDAAIFSSLEEGVSYTFCIDISKSVTEEEMEWIRAGIQSFVEEQMSAKDYVRIITIGSEITTVCDTTNSKAALEEAISQIDRTANSTYLYKGLAEALEGYRKNVNDRPERGAIIAFTDGMDDSDGAFSEDEVRGMIAEDRIPIYIIGLKGNDQEANLNSVGQIARQSGGMLYSWNDMSANEAVTAVVSSVQGAYQIHVLPGEDWFGRQFLNWKATLRTDTYSISSAYYVFSLGTDGVSFAPEETETETPEAKQEETINQEETDATSVLPEKADTASVLLEETDLTDGEESAGEESESEAARQETEISHAKTEQEKKGFDWKVLTERVRAFAAENLILLLAALLVLLALIILLAVLLSGRRARRKAEGFYLDDVSSILPDKDSVNPRDRGGNIPARGFVGGEDETVADISPREDEVGTVGFFDDGEETVDGSLEDLRAGIEFIITFAGQEKSCIRYFKDQITLGRGNDCDLDVVLGSGAEERKLTSRIHASIVRRQDTLYVRDEGARNKTFLNGIQVNGEMPVEDGDTLQLGKARVRLHLL